LGVNPYKVFNWIWGIGRIMMEYWKKYNEKLNDFATLMVHHNHENDFNFIENNYYNHIRDLTALSISMIQLKSKTHTHPLLKILDYGSNVTTWANIHRKINTDSIDVTVFDPFHDSQSTNIDLGFRLNIVSEEDDFMTERFDLTIFGSCVQYDENFLSDLNSKNLHLGDYVLFTHTPLSLEKPFVSRQFSDYTGMQTIHSFKDVSKVFEKMGYNLIFKSTLPPEGSSVEDEYINKTVYANLLFTKLKN
jgi:hypothetical protein|tara:strand:+ start:314 stop:1057 length:744 start_codon:yes stop_codon:yes gene_type:complete